MHLLRPTEHSVMLHYTPLFSLQGFTPKREGQDSMPWVRFVRHKARTIRRIRRTHKLILQDRDLDIATRDQARTVLRALSRILHYLKCQEHAHYQHVTGIRMPLPIPTHTDPLPHTRPRLTPFATLYLDTPDLIFPTILDRIRR